jgi:hypothetical protein
MPNIIDSPKEKEVKGGSNNSKKSDNLLKTMTKDSKRRGRPPGSKNKIKHIAPPADAAPKVEQPPLLLPSQNAALVEPLTKRAKIQAELQQGLQPIAIGTASAASGKNSANAPGATKPPVVPIRRPPQPQSDSDLRKPSAKETSRNPATTVAAAAASESIPRPASCQLYVPLPALCSPTQIDPPPLPEPSTNNNNNNNNNKITKSPGKKTDLAPGEALRTWLEENKVVVEEEKLIDELPEDIPQHQPSAKEVASNAACAEFQALLPGLTSAREAISHAAAAALKVAATGASARAVRMVVDAASDASGPPERLPYLYLLDSVVKLELRQAQEQEGKEEEKHEEGVQSGFRRAVGAALQRLVHLLLGDDLIRKKIDKLLGIWQREGLIAASLIGPVMESLEHDDLRRTKEMAKTDEQELKALLKETPMNTMMRITYRMPNGEEVVLGPPAHRSEPDDWSTPGELGIEIPAPPPRAVRKMSFLPFFPASGLPHSQSIGASPGMNQGHKKPLPPEYKDEEVSPWRREQQQQLEADGQAEVCQDGGTYKGSYATTNTNGYFQQQQYQPPPIPPTEQQPAVEEVVLDEFDQSLLRDAYGISGGDVEKGGLVVDPLPPPPVPPTVPPPHSTNGFFGIDGMHAAQCGAMPMNDAAFTDVGVGAGSLDMMQQQQWQQQAHMQEQMIIQQQMALVGGPTGMHMNTIPLQQQQPVHGGFGAVPPALAMGMQCLPSQQQQQYAMMNFSMMGGNDFGYGNAGMGMQQQQQQQQGGGGGGGFGGRGGDGQPGHNRQGGGYNHHQRDSQQHRQHQRHQNRYDPRNTRR